VLKLSISLLFLYRYCYLHIMYS